MIKNLLTKIFRGSNKNEGVQAQLELLMQQNALLQQQLNQSRIAEAQKHVTLNPQGMENEKINANLEVCVDTDYTERTQKDIRPIDFSKMDYNKLDDETKLNMKADLKEKLFEVGIDNIVETCEEYPTELLQAYLISLMCANNTYQAEYTNIDSMSRQAIINSIDEISFDNFCTAMKNKGFEVNPPSENQVKKLKELGFVGKMPKTSLGASKLIQSVVGETDNTPSEKQIARINTLIDKLGFQGEDYQYKTKHEASKVINDLQAIADEVLGQEKASPEQIRYYGQLLKACGKRLTQKRKEEAHNFTKKEISEAITKLKAELPDVATEGQVNYLVSLHQRLMIAYNIDDLKVLTKQGATDLIDKLNREVLYMETRRYQKSLTMKAIKEMTSKEVTDMIKQIQADKKDQKAV